MRALLDVNVLIALHDANHAQHALASEWFIAHAAAGWASCPLTQNGVLRIMAHRSYSNPQPMSVLVAMLRASTQSAIHTFWPDDLSLLDAQHFQHARIHSPKQLTDLYLLALAVKHGGRLVSFDQRIPLTAVSDASAEHLVVL
jgi:toxin-antitoxin system PIN domain toxin